MLPALTWYLLLTFLGLLTFPLVHRLFPALPDRGYSLSRAAGLLIWGYLFWLFGSLGLSGNDVGGILLALAIVAALSAWALVHRPSSNDDNQSSTDDPQLNATRKSEIINWLRSQLPLLLTIESLFLLAFAFMCLVRGANPEIIGTEKPMELMFINSIVRSPSFPPHDAWLSGFAISYYYFGYVIAAMLARLTGVPATMAFNLMISLVFALSAVGAYGIVYNLLAQSSIDDPQSITNHQSSISNVRWSSAHALPLFGPLFLLIISNIEGFLEVLHRGGVFWSRAADGTYSSAFWSWLNVKDLNQPPIEPLTWTPERHWWWWRASRVVQDFDLVGNFQEVIDEFPLFSFLLGDLHPHVLAIPFTLLAVAVALHILLGGWRGKIELLGARLHLNLAGFGFASLVLGGLAFLNTWDILPAASLIVGAYVLRRVRDDGWRGSRVEDALLLGLPAGITAVLLYLPFYLGFSSQAGGPAPNLINPTRGAHLWLMYSTLLLPLFAFLIYQISRTRLRRRPVLTALGISISLPLLLWGFAWLLALLLRWRDPAFVEQYLLSQGGLTASGYFAAALHLRRVYLGGLLTLLALLAPAIALLLALLNPHPEDAADEPLSALPDEEPSTAGFQPPTVFVLLLITLGTLLVLAPEFIYLRDQFGTRMNTVFKFYYQAWILWSLAAAFAFGFLVQRLRHPVAAILYHAMLIIVLFTGLTYPILSLASKTNNFRPFFGYTLDDFDRVQRESPDEAAAMDYLMNAPYGVVAEAASIGGSYTGFGRISAYTGQPALIGWPGHESQWRGGSEPQGTRLSDLETLYTTPSWEVAYEIIERYDIRYIVIGALERSTYPVQEAKFAARLEIAFQQGNVTVYEVPEQ